MMWAALAALADGWIVIESAAAAHDARESVERMLYRQAFKGETIEVEAVDITDQKQIAYEVKP